MIRSLYRLVAAAFLATLLATVHASTAIIVPDEFIADRQMEIKVDARIDDRPDLQARFNAYRVFLSTQPPGSGIGTACWLVFEEDINKKFINITIPASAAPEGAKLRISAGLMKRGAQRVNGFDYSVYREFQGGNATWAQAELNGRNIGWDQTELSCEAYGCARDCSDEYWDGERSGEAAARKCIEQCARDLNPRGAAACGVVPVTGAFIASLAIIAILVI